jgi:hypothetical protein
MIYTHVLNRGPGRRPEPGGPDVPVMTQPALHRGATQDSKGAPAGRMTVLLRDSQAKSGVFAFHGRLALHCTPRSVHRVTWFRIDKVRRTNEG